MTPPAGGVVVIGVGNPVRGDDGVGHAVIDALEADPAWGGARTVRLDGEPTRLIDAWDGAAHAVVVDAARTGDPAGTIEVVEVGSAEVVPAGADAASSHGLGLADAVRLGGVLDRLPGRLTLVLVAASAFDLGTGPGPEVAAAVPAAAGRVRALVADGRRGPRR